MLSHLPLLAAALSMHSAPLAPRTELPFAPTVMEYSWLEPVFDLNGDGVRDQIVTESASGNDLTGRVFVNSGSTGQSFRVFIGDSTVDRFGFAATTSADIDGDGRSELIVASPGSKRRTSRTGEVQVFSGVDGHLMYRIAGTPGSRYGFDVASITDQDGDGIDELVVRGATPGPDGRWMDTTFVQSGRTGALLASMHQDFNLLEAYASQGGTLFVEGDANGDGRVDVQDVYQVAQDLVGGDSGGSDVNHDGHVNADDVYIVTQGFVSGRAAMQGFSAAVNRLSTAESTALVQVWNQLYPEEPITAAQVAPTNPHAPSATPAAPGGWRPPVPCGVSSPSACSIALTGCPTGPVYLNTELHFGHSDLPGCSGSVLWEVDGNFYSDDLLALTADLVGTHTVSIYYHCTNPDSYCCATCTYTVVPCTAAVGFACPAYALTGQTLRLHAVGTPPNGTFRWNLPVGDNHPTTPTIEFPLPVLNTNTPEWAQPGHALTFTVTYGFGDGCYATYTCTTTIRADCDQDGRADDEFAPCNCSPDCDNDGYPNWVELAMGSNPNDPLSIPDLGRDTDGDGIPDVQEMMLGVSDWQRYDTDFDGVPDGAEIAFGLDPRNPRTLGTLDNRDVRWLAADIDLDGAWDEHERRAGLDAANPDTDGDGVPDGYELLTRHNPSNPADRVNPLDSDGDGLPDEIEQAIGTNAYSADSDGDGLPDGWELLHHLNPTAADSDFDGVNDAESDWDNDGVSSLYEYLLGTNPEAADSDGDGTTDGIEITQGSDPHDASDHGLAPSHEGLVPLYVVVRATGPSALHIGHGAIPVTRQYQNSICPIYEAQTTIYLAAGQSYSWSMSCTFAFDGYSDDYGHWWPCYGGGLHTPGMRVDISRVNDDLVALTNVADPTQVSWGSSIHNPAEMIGQASYFGTTTGSLWLPTVDVDADSDNDSSVSRSAAEEAAQRNAHLPGVLVPVNVGDTDGDGIPGFADGFNLNGNCEGTAALDDVSADTFAPIVLEAKAFPDAATRLFFLSYPGTSSISVYVDSWDDYWEYQPAGGALARLWTKPGNVARNPASIADGGDYVPPGLYTLAQLFGSSTATHTTLFLESIQQSGFMPKIRVTLSVNYYLPEDDFVPRPGTDYASFTPIRTNTYSLYEDYWGRTLVGNSGYIPVSMPTPTISNFVAHLGNLRFNADNTKIVADIALFGDVADRSCDLLPGNEGRIPMAQLWLNGERVVMPGSTTPLDISLGVFKGSDAASVLHPYPYSGALSTVISGVEIPSGWNEIQVTATNSYGLTGFARRSEFVQVYLPPSESTEFEIDTDGHDPLAQNASTSVVLHVRHSVDSTVAFEHTYELPPVAGSTVGVFGTDVGTASAVVVRFSEPDADGKYNLLVTVPPLALADQPVQFEPPAPNTSIYHGLKSIQPWEHSLYDGCAFAVTSATYPLASDGGSFAPFVIQYLGPSLDPDTRVSALFGGVEYDLTTAHFTEDTIGNVLGIDGSSHIFLAVPRFGEQPFSETPAPHLPPPDTSSFEKGFAIGFWKGAVVSIKDGAVSVYDGAVNLSAWGLNHSPVGLVYRWWYSGSLQAVIDSEIESEQAFWYDTQKLATLLKKVAQRQVEFEWAAITGDHDTVSKDVNEAVLLATVVWKQFDDYVNSLTNEEAGELFGTIAGQAAQLVFTTAGGGELLVNKITSLISKIRELEMLETIPLAQREGVAARLAELEERCISTGFCFEPGTVVRTAKGLMPIESIQVGDVVLSRGESGTDFGYCAVKSLIRTRPTTLWRVTWCSIVTGVESVTGTEQHPFWSVSRNRWIALRNLMPGEELCAYDGSHVTVEQVEGPLWVSNSGGRIQTYNLEVEDAHTYCVGLAGLVVHNTGPRCPEISGRYEKAVADLRHEFPNDNYCRPADAYFRTVYQQHLAEADEAELVTDTIKQLAKSVEPDALRPLDPRWVELGTDTTGNRQFRPNEVFAARNFELRRGVTLDRPRSAAEADADWVEVLANGIRGQAWSLKGPLPNDIARARFELPGGFKSEIANAVSDLIRRPTSTKLMVDMSGLTLEQKLKIIGEVERIPGRYFLLGD